MKIGIVGLGFMGGSLAKAFKKYTKYQIAGRDKDRKAEEAALAARAVDSIGGIETCDVVYVCLYPKDTVQYLLDSEFMHGAVLTDVCGVKRFVVEKATEPLNKKGLLFCGGHPLVGRVGSGFKDSNADIFRGAYYILMDDDSVNHRASGTLSRLAQEIGFAGITHTTAEEHDEIIAYTSQLTRVISAAYVRNPVAETRGFSSGGFENIARTAKLNNMLWSELFLENSENLCGAIDRLIADISSIKDNIKQKNGRQLRAILQECSDIMEKIES